jgi:hypothetical protein
LIGNSKSKEQFMLGLWPYSYYVEIKGDYLNALKNINEIIKNPSLISEMLFLTMQ